MDYKTFAESHLHNRRPVEHVINLLKNRVDNSPSFALFLGAGASVASGVRAASSMLEEWRRIRYAASSELIPYQDWLNLQDWYQADDEYSQLFELVYDQPSQRRAYIENAVANGKPSWGYAFLTSLIEARIFNAIFTTNFDDLVNEACFQFGRHLRPLVCAHDSAVSSIRLMSDRPKVIKLHGDFLYDSIKNTATELSDLEQNMREKLGEFSREVGLIVLGYAGNDKSIMDALATFARSPGSFRNGVYWCIRRGSSPGPRLRQFLRNERVYWVEIDGFDQFMADLSDRLSMPLPSGVALSHQVVMDRVEHLFGSESQGSHPYIRYASGICGERYRGACELLRANGLQSIAKTVDGKILVDDMAEFTVPFMQAQYAAKDGEYLKAEAILQNLLPKVPADRVWRVYITLLDCLLDQGTQQNKLLGLLQNDVPKYSSSQDLAKCSYYALFLNEAELALQFADRSLEQNSRCTLATINKGLALLQLRDIAGVRAISNMLVADGLDERFRAAGYAMIGDLKSAIVPLQRSIALGDYSVSDALRDVAFRCDWANAAFLDALQPFVKSNSTLASPMVSHYPMSAYEQEMAATAAHLSLCVAPSREGPSNSELQRTGFARR